ncbi:uncharacterized protein LOC136096159 [Hydra vulgaris]|uniref:uncharacterized protein LOC136096159 n=1 Tax=Hydra vulgaris TaxID=6087 RepID=UPI0032E9D4C5
MTNPRFLGKNLPIENEDEVEEWLYNHYPDFVPGLILLKLKDCDAFPKRMWSNQIISTILCSDWWSIINQRNEKSIQKKLPEGFCKFISKLQTCPASSGSIERIFSSFGFIWSKVAPPIIVLSDSSDEEEISKQNLQPKARLSVRDQIPQKKVSNEFVMEVSQLIGKSIDEDLLAVAQFGMEMIEVESMVHKLLNNCDTEKPKRVSKRAFYQCVKHGNNLPKVLAFLNAGLNPTERIKGVDGLTALHVAAMKGHLEILLLLIFKVGRKNVDCADKRNKTPLFYAIEKKHLKTAQFLVKVGADVHLARVLLCQEGVFVMSRGCFCC